jgi:oxygen-independent coproporphyrinogen-3 oxidase
MKYWTGGEYLGFGPDASSDFAGKRFTIVRDLYGYVEAMKKGGSVMADVQEVPPRERAGEYLMTRLRTTNGISQEEYEKLYLLPFAPLEQILERYAMHAQAAITSDGRWYLTPEGFLISNTIITDLLIAQDKTVPLGRTGK